MNALIHIANVFNKIAEAHSELASFHFGWRSDVNWTVSNNYNDGTGEDLGKQYPALHLVAAPRGTLSLSGNAIVECMLFVDLLHDTNNAGERTTDTLLTAFAKAVRLGSESLLLFKRESKQFIPKGQPLQIDESTLRWSTDSNAHNDQLVSAIFEFNVIAKIDCNPPNVTIDWDNKPIPDTDLEADV